MESIGRLAGGVAHDFNNILTVILGYSEMALENVGEDSPIRDDLVEISRAAMKSRDITQQLLAFARKQTIAPEVLDLNETVDGLLRMLQRLISEDIHLDWKPGDELWNVRMDPSQIDQMLTNLCVNARDAISGVGRITIETANVSLGREDIPENGYSEPGDFVMLSVSDDGRGINSETLQNIFEPFYTTKTGDSGSGLGLSMVYGIVRQNQGFINVDSVEGKGSTFTIYLPRTAGENSSRRTEESAKVPQGNGETILLVEDDIPIMQMSSAMLQGLGYTVISAGTPSRALELLKENSNSIRLMMTDVVMPEMNGRVLAEEVKKTIPSVKVLFMSGYTANVIAHRGVLDQGVNFIQKPFSRHELAKKLHDILI
jgi:CheY-like chemotaxis protein